MLGNWLNQFYLYGYESINKELAGAWEYIRLNTELSIIADRISSAGQLHEISILCFNPQRLPTLLVGSTLQNWLIMYSPNKCVDTLFQGYGHRSFHLLCGAQTSV